MDSTNMLSILKNVLPTLETMGVDINGILQNSLKALPMFFNEKIKEYQLQKPDLQIVIMISSRENEHTKEEEIWLIPVGVLGMEIKEQFTPINLNVLLSGFNVTDMMNNIEEPPEQSQEPTKIS